MTRRMRDEAYQADQWIHRYTGRVAAINRFIDELGVENEAGHPPYIPPICGGVDALALSISRDPGPKAGGIKGSGFLSIENDDPSAERMGRFLRGAGIDYRQVVPWNAYPWYFNGDPTAEQLCAGVEPLRGLIGLMPRLRVVLLHGPRQARAGSSSCASISTWSGSGVSSGCRHTTRVGRHCIPRTGSSANCVKPASATPAPWPQR